MLNGQCNMKGPIFFSPVNREESEATDMAIAKKPHLEFFSLDLESEWESPPGYPPGIEQRILASDLDEENKKGSRTRLMRFQPGIFTTKPFVHDHWEEVYLLEGDLIVGNDENGEGGEQFTGPTYACRPPGAYHGPFKSENGCMMLEFHFYSPDEDQA